MMESTTNYFETYSFIELFFGKPVNIVFEYLEFECNLVKNIKEQFFNVHITAASSAITRDKKRKADEGIIRNLGLLDSIKKIKLF